MGPVLVVNVLSFDSEILFTPNLRKAPANPSEEIYSKDSSQCCPCCNKAGCKVPPKLNSSVLLSWCKRQHTECPTLIAWGSLNCSLGINKGFLAALQVLSLGKAFGSLILLRVLQAFSYDKHLEVRWTPQINLIHWQWFLGLLLHGIYSGYYNFFPSCSLSSLEHGILAWH